MSYAADQTPLIFRRLSEELGDCERAGLRIEAAVADLIAARRETGTTSSTAALQELDELVQRLRDLAAFAGALGVEDRPDGAALDGALDTLKLARVRHALSGRPHDAVEAEREVLF